MMNSYINRRGFLSSSQDYPRNEHRVNARPGTVTMTSSVDKYQSNDSDNWWMGHQRQRSVTDARLDMNDGVSEDGVGSMDRSLDSTNHPDYENFNQESSPTGDLDDSKLGLGLENGNMDCAFDAARSFMSEQESRELARQKDDEIRRLKSQVEKHRALRGARANLNSSDKTAQQEENSKLQAKISSFGSERGGDKSKLSQMSSRLGEMDEFSSRGGGDHRHYQQQRPSPYSHHHHTQSNPPMLNGGANTNSKNMNQVGQQSMNGDDSHYLNTETSPSYNDPMIVDKMQLRVEALERELENERDNAQRLKEDNQRLSENIMQLQQESPSRQNSSGAGGLARLNSSKYEDANTNIINSQHHEINLLKAALESAKKEKKMLEDDHAKEKAMLLESNSKGDSLRREMIDLKKDFDDMQAAVLQLQHEMKLRNETIAELQQQLIFYQQLEKKRAMNSMDTSSSYTNTEIKKNNGSGSTLIIGGANNSGGGTSAPTGSSYVSDPSTIFECSRCHQLFKDMSQFQGHITSCLEYRLFHAANNRSKSADRGMSSSSHASMTNISKPSPFPSSPLDNPTSSTSGSTILTKYSYDNLRAAGLTNSSSQLKISAIDSRPAGSSSNVGPSRRQQPYDQAHNFDLDRSHAVSTPHLPVYDATSIRDRSNSEFVKKTNPPTNQTPASSFAEPTVQEDLRKPDSKASLYSSPPEVVKETVAATPCVLQMSKPTTDWKRDAPVMGKVAVAVPRHVPDTYKVQGTKSPEAQYAPTVMHLHPTTEAPQTRHSSSSSHSSSDYAKETSLELESEIKINNKEPPLSHVPKSQSSNPLEGFYEPIKQPSSPQSTLENSFVSNQQDEHPVFHTTPAVHSKAPSAPELLFDMAAAEARANFLQASRPSESSLQPHYENKERTTSPVYRNLPESQYLPEPQNAGIGSGQVKPPRLRPSSQAFDELDGPSGVGVLNSSEQPRPFVKHLNPQLFNKNGFQVEAEIDSNDFIQRPGSPGGAKPLRPQATIDFRGQPPPPQHLAETPKSPIERKSISFDDNEMIKKGNAPNKQLSAFDVNRPTPNSILKNASKGLQIIDKVNGGALTNMNPGAELDQSTEMGPNSRYNSEPRERKLSSNANQNDSDSNSSRQAEKERKYDRSKSPSIRNLKNRFFASDKKEKSRKSAPHSQSAESNKPGSQQSEDKPFVRSSNSQMQGPMKAFPQKSVDMPDSAVGNAPMKASFRPRASSKDRPQVEPPKPPTDYQGGGEPLGSLRRLPSGPQHSGQRPGGLEVSTRNGGGQPGPTAFMSPQNSFDRRGRPGPYGPPPGGQGQVPQTGGPNLQQLAAGGQYRRVRPRSQPPPPEGARSDVVTTDV